MNFYQARAISTNGLHVRRTGWSDPNQWFILWRGVWWYFTTSTMRPVRATDYTVLELTATDWTTVPTALLACPINTTIGSTGGGPPNPSNGLFATSSATSNTTPSGSGGLSGSGSTSLPPPDPGLSITVAFSGVAPTTHSGFMPYALTIDGTYSIPSLSPGSNSWHKDFVKGTLGDPPVPGFPITIDIGRYDNVYSVTMEITGWSDGYIGGFGTFIPQKRGIPIANTITADIDFYGSGTATIL